MPIFEYLCKQCGKRFEAIVYGGKKPKCPKCQGGRLEQQLSVFAVAGGGKSGSSDFGGDFASGESGACGSCGDPRGPGACSMDDLD
ncbi:MAG TPA: zinc ribbon domain-containing protein [Terriglobales bacterium]|nr:zinc ribbon domain-containing protein [Terriglobales bacterium]